MKILIINAGSSSIKYKLMDMENNTVLAKGLAERIGIAGSNLQHKPTGKDSAVIESPMKDHVDAMKLVFAALTDENHGVIESMDEIAAIGHRVLHGGATFSGSVIVTEEVKDAIRDNIPLGPLHNPANLMGIEACEKVMPSTPQVAVFDTAFHQTMPPKAFLYALPYEYYEKHKVRRYGFHGTSHFFVSRKIAELMGKKPEELKTIVCHLGSGASICAVNGGKSVDTSMGLTPLEGIMMGTRSGDMDPAILEFIMNRENLTVGEMTTILNKKSGLAGVGGISGDVRDNWKAMQEGNERATRALEIFTYRVKKYIGAYAAAMNGVDVIVMTAGIGENHSGVREMILKDLDFMGVKLDVEKNAACVPGSPDTCISAADSKVAVWMVGTDEEMAIANETMALVK